MNPQHKITDIQKEKLSALTCQRLSSDPNNLREVEAFYNALNETLVDTLKGEAYEEDEQKGTAYYVVKEPTGKILCFFSLKAGLLFDKHGDLEILQSKKALNLLIKKKQKLGHSSPDIALLRADLEQEIDGIKNRLKRWIELDVEDEKHKRVGKTFSGIEIVHFCINKDAQEEWEKLGFGEKNRIGLTIFWTKIIPIILKVRDLIGVDFLYLFAADTTEDRILINHYRTFMNLNESENIFAALPIYDMGCTLLCQKIEKLESTMKDFFNNFNATLEDDLK